jgi:peptidoglycan/LPS O-acetylase OafA/YrhL
MQPHTTSTALPRVRALDGLRGLAVAGVLAYHAGFGWARGGFLGVSLFFTLSGFLITSLLLAERSGTGRIGLGAFWARRARRLLPAALLALGGIVVFGATVATPSQLHDLRGDVLGALGYVANWRFVLAGTSYGDLWSSPSPVQHFWSLAIEEQLYVVLPLAVTGALVVGRGRRRPVALVLGALTALSVLATFLVHDQLRAYYGTDVRGAELLAGALLAVVVSARPTLGATRRSAVAGGAALAALLVAWSTTTISDGRLYDGGFLLHAALVVTIIVAARHDGPLATALSVRPLRWLGRVSYGAYLYHWPLFLWLDEHRTGLSGVPLAALRLAISLLVAWISVRVVEEPIRHGRRLPSLRAPIALTATGLAIAGTLVIVTASPPAAPITVDFSAAPALVGPSLDDAPPAIAVTPTTIADATQVAADVATSTPPLSPARRSDGAPSVPRAPGEPLRIYVAGDSNAYILGLKMADWGAQHNVKVWTSGWFACHIVPGGTYRWAGEPKHTEDKCNRWRETRAHEIEVIKPHVVVIMYGSFDMLDRRWDGSDEWTHIGRPDFDLALRTNIADMTDLLGAGGARVIWATYPRVRTGVRDGVRPAHDYPEFDEMRVDRLNTFIREAVAQRPFAGMLELRRYMQSWPKGELDPVKRPDGLHPNDFEAINIAEWIAEQVVYDVARR